MIIYINKFYRVFYYLKTKNNILRFYLPTNYLQAFRIQFDARIVSAEKSPIETDTILIQEMDEKNRTVYHKEIQQLNS